MGKQTISIIGAGNVATHLAIALANAGYTIRSVYSRTMESANALCEKLCGQSAQACATDRLDSICAADIYLISVKDYALEAVAKAWPKHCRSGVVLHTAGSIPMQVISSTSSHYGVLYPMQTFSIAKAVNLSKITCFIEGNDSTAEAAARELAESIFGRCQKLSSEERKTLHLAAVFCSNFTNHMYALAYEILEQNNINPTCLNPLIRETSDKVERMHPHEGQTGPARRKDILVIEDHINKLAENSNLQQLYKTISESIMRRF